MFGFIVACIALYCVYLLIVDHVRTVASFAQNVRVSSEVRTSCKCAIIGAGPAGLAAAKELKGHGCEVVIFDSENTIGGIWCEGSNRIYRSLRCNSSKEYMTLKDCPALPDCALYPSPTDVTLYLNHFAEKFNLLSKIRFGSRVDHVTRKPDGRWEVAWKRPTDHSDTEEGVDTFDCVVAAVGQVATPHIPTYPGYENFSGHAIHSRDFLDSAPFHGKKVLVVGVYSSGCDIAQDVSFGASQVYLSVRQPHILFVPRFIFGFSFIDVLMSKACFHFSWWKRFIFWLVSLSHAFRSGSPWSRDNVSGLHSVGTQ